MSDLIGNLKDHFSRFKAHTSFDFLHLVPWWTSSRLALAVLGFFGFINVYALRVNMSVAIVCMVNQTALKIAEANSSSNDTGSKVETDQQCGLLQAGNSNETDSGSFQVKFFYKSKIKTIL